MLIFYILKFLVTDPNGRKARSGFENRVPRTADEMVAYFQRHPFATDNRREIATFLAENIITDYSDKLSGLPDIPARPLAEKELKRRSYIQSVHNEHAKHARLGSPYTISVMQQVREVIRRRIQILRGDWNAQVIQLASFIFQAIIMGTIFFKVADATSAYFSRGGVLFL